MGVRYLNNLIGDKCRLALVTRHLSAYANTTIVVDTSIYLYKYLGENALMERMYSMMAQFKLHNIAPIFVFDGNAPQEKRYTLQDRETSRKCAKIKLLRASENVTDARNKLQMQMTLHINSPRSSQLLADNCDERGREGGAALTDANDPAFAISSIIDMESALYDLRKQCVRVRGSELSDVKRLMRAFGMRYIEADGESDNMCAQIVKLGIAHACMSDDMDMLLYNCPRVLRNFNIDQETVIEYDLQQILAMLDVSICEFRSICILSGTDYNPHNFDTSIQHRIYLSGIFENYYRFRKMSLATVGRCQDPAGFYEWIKNTNWLFRCIDVRALERVYEIFSVELTNAQLENIGDVMRRNEQESCTITSNRFEIPPRVKKIMAQYNFIYID
jgi:5'-3' exonuclease